MFFAKTYFPYMSLANLYLWIILWQYYVVFIPRPMSVTLCCNPNRGTSEPRAANFSGDNMPHRLDFFTKPKLILPIRKILLITKGRLKICNQFADFWITKNRSNRKANRVGRGRGRGGYRNWLMCVLTSCHLILFHSHPRNNQVCRIMRFTWFSR